MTYPHDSLEQRVQLLEAAVARLTRDLGELQRRPVAPAGGGTVSIPMPQEIDKWTLEWIASWNERGHPVARIATPLECRKQGGGGKGDWDGDPVVKYDPKFWKKESWAGRKFSQCPPEYLEMHASNDEYRAFTALKDPEKKKWAKYNLRGAALAKGWARLIREDPGLANLGHALVSDANEEFDVPDDGIPF